MPAAAGRYNDRVGIALPMPDWTEKESGIGTISLPAGVATQIIQTSVLQIVDSGPWWVWLWVQGAITLGATPPTDLTMSATFVPGNDFDAGGDLDVHHIPRQLLVANAVVPFGQMFQLFGTVNNPPNVLLGQLKATSVGQTSTLGGYCNASMWGLPKVV